MLLSGTGGDEVFFGYRSHAGRSHSPIGSVALRAARGAACCGRRPCMADAALGAQHRTSVACSKLSAGLSAPDRLARHLAVVDWSGPDERRAPAGTHDRRVPAIPAGHAQALEPASAGEAS